MRFTHSIGGHETRFTFDGKPSEAIRSALKRNGFRWQPATRTWGKRGCIGVADLIGWIDRQLNPGRPDGACWVCGEANGFFRPEGAATPVRCDECQKVVTQKQYRAPTGTAMDRVDMAYEDDCARRCGL